MPCPAVTAVAFDLGDTLLEYEGLPLSWEAHYPDALRALGGYLGHSPSSIELDAGAAALRRFNTRLNPRVHEVTFAAIVGEVAVALGAPTPAEELAAARAFFSVFRQRLRVFPDAVPTLRDLRARGIKLGIFTDVPYGMPRELVIEDVAMAGLDGEFDVLITSRDAGYRKPAANTLSEVARALNVSAPEMLYVGNEGKDIEAARNFGCPAALIDRAGSGINYGQSATFSTLKDVRDLRFLERNRRP